MNRFDFTPRRPPPGAVSLLISAALVSAGCDHMHPESQVGQAGHGRPMTEAAVAMPISPGQTGAWQAALTDLIGPRYAEYDESRRRYGLDSQTTFLQRTPMGDFALVHMTGRDVVESFHRMSQSKDPWDQQWRQLTHTLHGVDFAKENSARPAVEAGFSMQSGDQANTRPFMFMAPLGPGRADEFRALARTLMGERHAEYLQSRERIGVRREASFLQSTPMGDAVIFYWQAENPQASLARLKDSSAPFDRWLQQTARGVHPVSLETLAATASGNQLVARYPKPQ